MQIGDSIKVHLPGESPWADVVAVFPGGFVGKICSDLVRGARTEYVAKAEKECGVYYWREHNHVCGDLIVFAPHPEWGGWYSPDALREP